MRRASNALECTRFVQLIRLGKIFDADTHANRRYEPVSEKIHLQRILRFESVDDEDSSKYQQLLSLREV